MKVFDAVPISEPWSIGQITSEIPRLGHSPRTFDFVAGCLDTLKRAGLITEPDRGKFKRVPVRAAAVRTPPLPTPPSPPTPTGTPMATTSAPANINNIDKLDTLVNKLRLIANELETIALDIDDEIKDSMTAAQQLKQLKSLLKGLD